MPKIIRIHASCYLQCELLRVRHCEHFSGLCFSVYSVTKHSDRPMEAFKTRKLRFWLLSIGNSDCDYCVDVILFRRPTVLRYCPAGAQLASTATNAEPSRYQVSFSQIDVRRFFTFIRNTMQPIKVEHQQCALKCVQFLVSSTRSSYTRKVDPPAGSRRYLPDEFPL